MTVQTPTAAIDLSYNCRAPPPSPVLCAAMGREKQEMWDGGCSVLADGLGWAASLGEWHLDAASLSALALGKLPELLVMRRHSQQERLGCSVPRGILSFSPMICLLTDWASGQNRKKNMTLPYQFLKYLNYFFLPKSLASKTISIVNTLVLSLWKFNWIFSINTLYAYIYIYIKKIY